MKKKRFTAMRQALIFVVCAGICAVVDASGLTKEEVDILLGLSLEELMEIPAVSVATGSKQSSNKAPSVTTVITAKDIRDMGANTLSDILQTVPGLHVRHGSVFFQANYAVRGLSTNFNPEILVLINGLPVNHFTIGGSRRPFWDAPLIHDIARIEVVRGPGSAVHGADAYSGVINIITKNAKDINGLEAGARTGSFDSHEAWLLAGDDIRGFNVSFTLQYADIEGYRKVIERDAQTLADEKTGTSVSVAPGPMNLQRTSLDARLEVSKDDWLFRTAYQGRYHVGRALGSVLDPSGMIRDTRYDMEIAWHNTDLSENWELDAHVSHQDLKEWPENDLLFRPPGSILFAPDGDMLIYPHGVIFSIGFAERHSRLELSTVYKGLAQHRTRLGWGLHYANIYDTITKTNRGISPFTGKLIPPDSPPINVTGTDRALIPSANRRDKHIYLQDIWAFMPDWELTTGLRYDKYSDFGGTLNPRVAVVKTFSEDLTAKILYGKAFRAPSVNELAVRSNSRIAGNPDIRPETIDTWELAVDWQAMTKLRVTANVFYYEAKDKIEFAPSAENPDVDAMAQNIGTQTGHGGELELRRQLGRRFNLLVNYAYQHSVNEKTDSTASLDPKNQAYLRGDWLFAPNWHLHPQLTWVGKRNRLADDTRAALGSYTLADLNLRYLHKTAAGDWHFAVGVRNALDENARDPSPDGVMVPFDYPLAGRSWYMELACGF